MNEIQTTQAERLRQLHSEIIVTLNITLDKAIEAGGILRDVKESLPHGEFGKWVESNTGFNIRSAQRYMKVFDNRDQLKSDSVSYLNEAHRLLTEPKLPNDFYIPPAGCGLIFYTEDEEGNVSDFVIVVPHVEQGYCFRSWNEGQNDDGGQIVGDTRGINIEHIKLGCPLSQGTWERIVVKPGKIWAGPWDYNLMLFFNDANYREGIRLETIESKESIDKLTHQLSSIMNEIDAVRYDENTSRHERKNR